MSLRNFKGSIVNSYLSCFILFDSVYQWWTLTKISMQKQVQLTYTCTIGDLYTCIYIRASYAVENACVFIMTISMHISSSKFIDSSMILFSSPIAMESIVLLENRNNVLPLNFGKSYIWLQLPILD